MANSTKLTQDSSKLIACACNWLYTGQILQGQASRCSGRAAENLKQLKTIERDLPFQKFVSYSIWYYDY